jgi:hypothetical protein
MSCACQACQSSLNNAGLALVLQAVATGMLVTANMANEDYSGALADIIQVGRVGWLQLGWPY